MTEDSKHRLDIQRKIYNAEDAARNTIGELFGDKQWLLNTLEDEVRPNGVKEFGETALPASDRYLVIVTWSPKFKRMLPLIYTEDDHSVDVKGVQFSGVRFHNGIHEGHSHGCVLTGLDTDGLKLIGKAEDTLTQWLMSRKKHWPIPLTITDMPLSGGGLTKQYIEV